MQSQPEPVARGGVGVPGELHQFRGTLLLTEPLLAWQPSALSPGLARLAMTSLSEMVLAVTLARAVDGLEEGR